MLADGSRVSALVASTKLEKGLRAMFKKLLDELLAAQTEEQINHILYRAKSETENWGVDLAFQHDKISWQDHERLFALADRLCK